MSGVMLMLVGGKGGEAPANTVAPALSDSTPVYNQTISTTTGTWDSITTPSFAYQWQRNGSNIGGATSSSYTIVADDVGNTVRCVVTATNPFGSTAANSNTSSAVGRLPDAPTIGTATAGDAQATVTFTPPAQLGFPSSPITYRATASPGGANSTSSSSPITVTGLSNGTSYTFTVTATNPTGTGPASSASNSVSPASATDRGVFAGGGGTNVIDFVQISSGGTATDFGDTTSSGYGFVGAGSSTRGLFSQAASTQYITLASAGNATYFGSAGSYRTDYGGLSNNTRAVWMGGLSPFTPIAVGTMQYATISSIGSNVSFGTLSPYRYYNSSFASTTRGITGGGRDTASEYFNNIAYITIASTGDSTFFGSLGAGRNLSGAASSNTRGIFPTGQSFGGTTNRIEYITIASTGGGLYFADCSSPRYNLAGTSNGVTMVFGGGQAYPSGSRLSSLRSITIASSGTDSSFGSLTDARENLGATSGSHGGI